MRKIVMLSNLEYTLHRPIVQSVINDLKENFFENKDLYVRYLDNKTNNDFSSTDNIDTNNKVLDQFLEVNTTILTNEDLVKANVVMRNIRRPILNDPGILFDVTSNTLYTDFAFKIKSYDKSKDRLVRMINSLKLSSIADNTYGQHDVEYYYTIPIDLLALIKDINEKRNGKDKSYYKYIEHIASVKIEYLNSRSGEYNTPIIREKQPVLGNFNSDLTNIEIQKDEKGYFIELDYFLNLELPTFLKIDYPILVHNKIIDRKFLPKDNLINLIQGADSIVDALYNQIGFTIHDEIRNGEPLIRYPSYDDIDFKIPQKPGMLRLFSILLIIDEDKPNFVLKLDNLLDMFINPHVVEFFKQHKDRSLFKPLENVFHFELFENNYLVDYDLHIDENNNVVSSKPLDKTKVYRFVLNGLYDFNYLVKKDILTDKGLNHYIKTIERLKVKTINYKETAFYDVMVSHIIANNKEGK